MLVGSDQVTALASGKLEVALPVVQWVMSWLFGQLRSGFLVHLSDPVCSDYRFAVVVFRYIWCGQLLS